MVKRILLKVLLTLLFIFFSFLIYSLLPRVPHRLTDYGQSLSSLTHLSEEEKAELTGFVKDTASNMQHVIAVQNGKILYEYGDPSRLVNCHSVRKSVISLLFGIAIDKGLLTLNETLEDLGIDESKTPLTAQEKRATVRDLLMARSGVYLPAEAETAFAKANRPKREQYRPGQFFFYNNFDFNALGAILEKKTGKSIGEFMEEFLAKPVGMQEFSSDNVVYGNPWPVPNKTNSDYSAYYIFLSARDLARIGMLVAQKGKWNGKQLVSSAWIEESTRPHTDLSEYNVNMQPLDAYGYLWWLDFDTNTIWADGYGGQFMIIDSARKLVVVQRNFTGNSLLSSGLFLSSKKRNIGSRDELKHVYLKIKENMH